MNTGYGFLLGVALFVIGALAGYVQGRADVKPMEPVIAIECWTTNSAPRRALLGEAVTITAPNYGSVTVKHTDGRMESLGDIRLCAYSAGWRWQK